VREEREGGEEAGAEDKVGRQVEGGVQAAWKAAWPIR
jgi:hypothetical protein